MSSGKQPFFLKPSQLKQLALTERYKELKAAGGGKLDKFMEKRRCGCLREGGAGGWGALHSTPPGAHISAYTLYPTPPDAHISAYTLYPTPPGTHISAYTPVPRTSRTSRHTHLGLYPVPHTSRHTSRPIPCTPHLQAHTSRPIPCTPHLQAHTSRPIPCTPQPTPPGNDSLAVCTCFRNIHWQYPEL